MHHYPLYVMMFLIASIAGNSMAAGQANVTVSLTVKSVDLSGNPLNGMWTELYFDGRLIASGFTPVTFTVNSGSQYSVAVADFQDIVFNHWEDGSTNRFRTIMLTQDTTVTAFYSTGGTSNNPPIAVNDSVATTQNKQIAINVLANDSDPDHDSLIVDSVTAPSSGTAEINQDETITYAPNLDFVGSDSFAYTVSDTKGATDTATVSVTINSSGGTQLSIKQIKSGLVAFDPLNNATLTKEQLKADTRYWTYGGSAEGFKPPALFDFFQNSTGRYIGVQAPASGTYAGYYAVTPPTSAKLFHAVLTMPYRSISGDFFNNGLYVQTANGKIIYVTCVVDASPQGISWHIVRTNGNFNDAKRFETLWSDPSPTQPLTRDCTIITNGSNYLKVYLDNVMVYSSSNLNLRMPAPFLYFLEPQNSHPAMLYGEYRDFYIAADENIQVINAPSTAKRVDVVSTSRTVLASSQITNGAALIDVGKYHFPLAAQIIVYDSNGIALASTSASIFGGDVYAIN